MCDFSITLVKRAKLDTYLDPVSIYRRLHQDTQHVLPFGAEQNRQVRLLGMVRVGIDAHRDEN